MKKPRGGTWLGIACALIIAFAWGRGSNPSNPTSAQATTDVSGQPDDVQTPTPAAADTSFYSPPDTSQQVSDSDDDDQYATSDDDEASDSDATVCDDDSYVNSDGHCVHRPEYAASPPDGASAQCNDGTYSFSEHRRGTCSYHGGVAQWL